jgi:hypothetical protein
MKKVVGIFCLTVAVLSFGWALGTVYLSPIGENDIQLGRISAPEGTVLIVKNGSPELYHSSGRFSVEKPIMSLMEKVFWFISSIAALCSGLLLLWYEDENAQRFVYVAHSGLRRAE